jgi:hypothetical protein
MAFFIAALIWAAASFDAGSRRLARSITGITLIAVVIHAVLIARYFFILPLLFDIIVAVTLAIALVAMRSHNSGC